MVNSLTVSETAVTIEVLDQATASIERLVLRLADIYRMEHLGNQITMARITPISGSVPDRCWACGTDREAGDKTDCSRCGASFKPF